MLDEVVGRRLRAVERFAWQSDRGSPTNPEVGSVHMWFEGGRGVHLDGASDWTLRGSVTEPGDDGWIGQYLYDHGGRWVVREATEEQAFVGLTLHFEGREVSPRLHEVEINTSSR